MSKLRGRLGSLKKNNKIKQRIGGIRKADDDKPFSRKELEKERKNYEESIKRKRRSPTKSELTNRNVRLDQATDYFNKSRKKFDEDISKRNRALIDSSRESDAIEKEFVNRNRKVNPKKHEGGTTIRNKKRFSKLKQRIATLQRLAVEQQITLEGDVAPERVRGRPRTVAKTKEEVIKAFKEGKPLRTKTPFRHGERIQPTYRTDGKNFFLYGNKILSKHDTGYQTHVKDFINDDNYEQITLDTLRDFGMQVNSEGKIIPAEQFFTKDGLAMKIKTRGDLTKKDMVIPANEISDGRVLINKYKPPTGIKRDTYPYTPENLRNFSAESRRRATSMQVNSEGKRVPVGTLKGDPTGTRKRSLSETATQPDDAKTVNKILGLPEEQGLEKTFGKKKYDKKKTKTTYNKGKYKGIEGSKTHHTLFKKKTGISRPNPVARFKHTRNVKATPKGSFASPFANNPENAIQLSKPEHKELHRLNPHSNFRNIFESKLRLKIARMRYAEQDWSDIQDTDFFKNPYKPRKMTPDMGNMEYMDDLHNKASWNAGQRAMEEI